MKKLIPAIVMLLVSAVVLSTASYAWFTVSADVSADGMSVTASAPTSILISQVTKNGAKYSYNGWSSSTTFTAAATNLYAASSVNGTNFVTAEKCEDLKGGAALNSAFVTANNVENGTQYYVDYTFAVKNTSPDADVVLEIGSITLGGYALKDAVRVAIFVDEDFTAGEGIVYNPGDAGVGYVVNSGNQAVGPIGAPILENADTWAEDVKGTAAASVYKAYTTDIVTLEKSTQNVSEDTTAAEGDTTAAPTSTANDNAHIITVRIWFEGQSAACISDYAGQNVTIAMTFVKGTADN